MDAIDHMSFVSATGAGHPCAERLVRLRVACLGACHRDVRLAKKHYEAGKLSKADDKRIRRKAHEILKED